MPQKSTTQTKDLHTGFPPTASRKYRGNSLFQTGEPLLCPGPTYYVVFIDKHGDMLTCRRSSFYTRVRLKRSSGNWVLGYSLSNFPCPPPKKGCFFLQRKYDVKNLETTFHLAHDRMRVKKRKKRETADKVTSLA